MLKSRHRAFTASYPKLLSYTEPCCNKLFSSSAPVADAHNFDHPLVHGLRLAREPRHELKLREVGDSSLFI